MLEKLTRRKVIDSKCLENSKLDRCLTTFDLTALGIGATLGVGIYVLAGSVAKEVSGPSIVLSFLIAGIASALSGICYAELGARVPKSGSAYVYSYATVGELVAFVIGWNLLLEYAIGAASVSRAYSGYLDSLLNKTMQKTFRYYMPMDVPHLSPYPDLCSLLLALILTSILSFGVKESTRFNNLFTCLNLAVVSIVAFAGLLKSDLSNWSIPESSIPSDAAGGHGGFFPFGISGTLAGAATCFYGYVGFDSIATSGEETKNPQRSIPISICVSLFVVFLGYFGVSAALTLMVPYYLQDSDAPLPAAFRHVGWNFVGSVVSVGALFGLSTSLLGCMFPLPRVLYAMASDGLVFRTLAKVNPTFQTPLRATVSAGIFVGTTSALFELKSLVDMMSIGTLMAYTIVSASVILLRYQDIPGLGASRDYIALGSLGEQTGVFQNGVDDTDSDEEEIVYCRSSDLANLTPMRSESAPTFGVSLGDFCSGLLNADRSRAPTEVSSKIASTLTVTYSVLAAMLALILNNADFERGGVWTVVAEVFLGIIVFFMTLCLLFLSLQPKTTQVLSFRVPFVPVIPGLSIFINMYLMLKLSSQTWVRFVVWMTVGLAIYFGYGVRNSSEEYRAKGKTPPNVNAYEN